MERPTHVTKPHHDPQPEPIHLLASRTTWALLISLIAGRLAAHGCELTPEAQAWLTGGMVALTGLIMRLLSERPATLRRRRP